MLKKTYMIIIGRSYLRIFFVLFFLTSCNDFQKLLRNEDIKVKYEMAEKYYENEEWRRASTLFEQIQPQY